MQGAGVGSKGSALAFFFFFSHEIKARLERVLLLLYNKIIFIYTLQTENAMPSYRLVVSEIEHHGDLQSATEQLHAAGCENVVCVESDFDEESALFSFTHSALTKDELRLALDKAEVCY